MKNLLTFALCAAVAGSMYGQTDAVKSASKLSGKLDKLSEARTLIKGAMDNEQTKNQAETYFTAGKIEFDAFDKGFQAKAINPNDPSADPVAMADQLMNGYNYFLKALPLDSLPNEKGQVKPKFSSKILSAIQGHASDFFTAGASYFNDKKYYPEAYEAFMVYGNLPESGLMGKSAALLDSAQIATSFFNAGLSAYSGNEVEKSGNAFHKAIEYGYPEKEAYIYEIASWQALAQRDSTKENYAQDRIMDVASLGYQKFGTKEPLFLNNMINSLVSRGQYDRALQEVNRLVTENPDNGDILGLRAFINDRMDKDDAAVEDYRKAATLPEVGFETLRNASKKILLVGTSKYNELDGAEPEKRQAIKENYYIAAKNIAEKADQMNPGDPDLQNVIESIQYALDTYFNH